MAILALRSDDARPINWANFIYFSGCFNNALVKEMANLE
jgi:hypothetical protein